MKPNPILRPANLASIRAAWLAVICGWAAFGVATVQAVPAITLGNYAGGETLGYSVPLIQGTLADTSLSSVTVTNQSSARDTASQTCLAYNGRFKALIELVPGPNQLVITAGAQTLPLQLTYLPPTTPEVVRIVYAVDRTGDTTYQTPDPLDAQDYAGKLGTMLLMMQTFTAERMNELGMGRRTFNLELDANGKVMVRLLVCNKTAEEIYNLGGGGSGLYSYLAGQCHALLPNASAKNLIIPAFSRFDPLTLRNKAYTALGGGDTALFGGSNLYCYPTTLAEIQTAFMNATPIDTAHFSNDSIGRNVYWANASTSIGATLHELGHTFGLSHSRDSYDIMTRGFDYFSRFWVLREAPSANTASFYAFPSERAAHWGLASAAFQLHTRWLAMAPRTYSGVARIEAVLGADTHHFVVSSPDGIGAVILGSPGSASTAVARDWLAPAPTNVGVNALDYPLDLGGTQPWLRVIDSQANVRNFYLSEVRAAAPDTLAPSTPGNVAAVARSSTAIDLTWAAATDDRGVTGYEVRRDATLVATVDATHFTETGLPAATRFSYTVVALDVAGNPSLPGGPASVSTPVPDTQPPSAPAGLTATALTSGSLLLQWPAAWDNRAVTGYEIYQDGGFLGVVQLPGYEVRGLVAATAYGHYTVKACDADGNLSEQSMAAGATTLAAVAVLAGESFDYPEDASLKNLNGGTGWSNAWSVGADLDFPATVVRGDAGVNCRQLVYSAHHLKFWSKGNGSTYQNLDRTFLNPVSDNGQTVWLAMTVALFDAKNAATWQLAGLATDATLATAVNLFELTSTSAPGALKFGGSVLFTGDSDTTPHLLLVQIRMSGDAGPETVTAYCDPDLGGDPAAWAGVTNANLYANDGLSGFRYRGGRASSSYVAAVYLDEIRLATTWQGAVGLAPDVTAPTVPAQLTATALSPAALSLTWAAASDAMGVLKYDVACNGSLVATVTGTSFTHTGLIDSTVYRYTVTARDAAGNVSAASAAVAGLTAPVFVEESFDAPGTHMVGQDGGSGWSSPWTMASAKDAPYNDNTLAAGSFMAYAGLAVAGNHMVWWTATGSTPQALSRSFQAPLTDNGHTYWMAFEVQESLQKNRAGLWLNGYTATSLLSLNGGNTPTAPAYYLLDDTSANSTNRLVAATSAGQLFVFKIQLSGVTGNADDVVSVYVNPDLGAGPGSWTAVAIRTIDLSGGITGITLKSNNNANASSWARIDELRVASTWQAAVGQGAMVDANANGMPDDWEIARFASLTNPLGAADYDWDHDSQNNLHEYLAGTDPTDPASVLRITGVARDGGGNLLLQWPSVTGRSYGIQTATNLRDGFRDTGDPPIAGTGDILTKLLPVGPEPTRFYRVFVIP